MPAKFGRRPFPRLSILFTEWQTERSHNLRFVGGTNKGKLSVPSSKLSQDWSYLKLCSLLASNRKLHMIWLMRPSHIIMMMILNRHSRLSDRPHTLQQAQFLENDTGYVNSCHNWQRKWATKFYYRQRSTIMQVDHFKIHWKKSLVHASISKM